MTAETQNEFVISRTFDAPRDLVWKVHTEAEHLNHWWGPKGFKCTVRKLDLRPGGIFLYYLQAPDGTDMWGKFVFREVVPQERLVFTVSFSDENAGVTRHPMAPAWPLETLSTLTFTEQNGKTTVTVRWVPHTATQAEREAFAAGFDSMTQGWTGTLDKATDYLARIQQR